MDVINQSVNESIKEANLGQITTILSYVPRTLTKAITEFLNSNNLNVSERWVSGLFILISLGLLYVAIKLLNKASWIIKAVLIILSVALLVGIFMPW